MRLLVNLPIPVPSLVFVVKAIVGFWLVLQTTPLAVIAPPPSLLMLPPLMAIVEVIDDTVVVVKVAGLGFALLGLLLSFLQEDKTGTWQTKTKTKTNEERNLCI